MSLLDAESADPIEVYEQGLAAGCSRLETDAGTSWELPIPNWSGATDAGDAALLARCLGPTLDIGCGPGRLTAELGRRGLPTLGVDISALAVAMTRARGGSALCRDVFSLTVGERRWRHVILADGNVGIGADPVRMLWRCRDLLAPGGSVLLDVEPAGVGLRCGRVRLVHADRVSDWFGWAWLGLDALAPVAAAVGLGVADVWSVAAAAGPRWQAELIPAPSWPRPTRRTP